MGNSGLKQHYETAKKTGVLNLSSRKLDDFPQGLCNLGPHLRTLDLSGNKFLQLPNDIGAFVLLKHLNLSQNKLAALPDILGALVKLESLDVSKNQIRTLPQSLGKLSHLKQVNLSDNQISEFPLMLCNLGHLDVLDISKNKLTTIPDGASALQVIELNLNQNQMSSISEKMADCPRLKTLRLEENCLVVSAIPTRILKDSKISNLTLDGNLFEMRQFTELDGYDQYIERYTAVKKKLF